MNECDVCHKIFRHFSRLRRHKDAVHNIIKRFICDICNKAFSRRDNLSAPKLVHSDKAFVRNGDLTKHKCIHSGEKWYACDVSFMVFTRSSTLTNHKRVHNGIKLFTCDICNKSFSRKNHLVRHKRIHCNERPYTCDICNKAFVSNSFLAGHKLRIHSAERPNVNKEDGDVLSSFISSQLRNAGHEMLRGADVQQTDDTEHIYNSNTCEQMHGDSTSHKTHTADKSHELNRHKGAVDNGIGIKRFTCDICNKAFTRRQDMTSRKRIHSGEKPYICDVCFRAFTHSGSLANHSIVKLYTCDICDKPFSRRDNMTMHKRIHSCERS